MLATLLLWGGATGIVVAGESTVAPADAVIRINAGATTPFTDAEGNVWLADQGFTAGDTIDRWSGMKILNTTTPELYRTERYSMQSFSRELPNGSYVVKLHFAETYEGVGRAGDRVFSFNVEGKEFADFDIFVKAGGIERAYIEAVEVEIADGKLDITFTHKIENPAINAIEIVPAP